MAEPAPEHPFHVGQVLYRYEDYVDFSCSSYSDDRIGEDGGQVKVRCVEGRIERLTPKGAHASFPWRKTRWISATGRKRYAYPTREQAWASFQARKRIQASRLRWQLQRAEAALLLYQPGAPGSPTQGQSRSGLAFLELGLSLPTTDPN